MTVEGLYVPRCDVCGLEDRGGFGDGLATCDCPHCEWCGHRWGSSITSCECDDDLWDREEDEQ